MAPNRLWSQAEDEKLLRLCSNKQQQFLMLRSNNQQKLDWEAIAEQFPGRTLTACQARWQNKLNPAKPGRNSKGWTQEEHEKLRQMKEVEKKTYDEMLPHLPGRTRGAIESRCCTYFPEKPQFLNSKRKARGPNWTKDEQEKLLSLMNTYNNDDNTTSVNKPMKWEDIAKHIPGRSRESCKEQWALIKPANFKSRNTRNEWSAEEDAKLLQVVNDNPSMNWSEISELLPGRKKNPCRDRYCKLRKELENDNDNNNNTTTLKHLGRWTEEEDAQLVTIGLQFEKLPGNQRKRSFFDGKVGNRQSIDSYNRWIRKRKTVVWSQQQQSSSQQRASSILHDDDDDAYDDDSDHDEGGDDYNIHASKRAKTRRNDDDVDDTCHNGTGDDSDDEGEENAVVKVGV